MMKRYLFCGSVLLASATLTSSSSVRATIPEIFMAEGEGHHHHGAIAIPDDEPMPTVNLIVHPDAERGWNVEIQVANFRFAPEKVNWDSQTAEGHAHLYVNGQKVTRLYGNWYYLSELPLGRNEIKVTLNTNKHEALMHDGQLIEATATIEVK